MTSWRGIMKALDYIGECCKTGKSNTEAQSHRGNILSINRIKTSASQRLCVLISFATSPNSDKPVKYFSLDVFISVGYRVKSIRGTQFRQWANSVLKEYLLKGYSINQRINQLESRIESKFANHELQLEELTNKVDFFVRTSLPPVEGIFFDGQIFDAYKFVLNTERTQRILFILNILPL